MSDADAYMALALNNAQGELHPLEEGMHAIGSGLDTKAYSERVGKARTSIQDKVKAARVAESVTHMRHDDLANQWRALAELHGAPRWLWPALVSRLVEDGWTVDAARRG